MGIVYEAFDRVNRSAVALKALRPLEPDALLAFKREFRALADVEHDNLVRLGDLFVDGDDWYFTMELVEGVDFVRWARGGDRHAEVQPPLDEARIWAALRQLALGLDALHAAGKVHRDVKPENVIVTPAGRVVLLDFGLIADAGSTSDRAHGAVGTALYMAPEQAASDRVGPEADWYSVGVMLHEILVGKPPFSGPALGMLMEKQRAEPPAPRDLDPSLPASLSDLCVDLLRREPEHRLTGARAMSRLGAGSAAGAPVALGSVHRAQPFIGRSRELAELRLAWAAARGEAAHAVAVVVRGESGIGKSALVRRFLSDLHAGMPNALVLSARCYEREAVPFKAFDGIVDGLSRFLADIPHRECVSYLPDDCALVARLFPVLRRVPALATAPDISVPSPQELRTRAFSAVRDLVTRIASRRRTVLFIDDVQWADADSIALLHHVLGGSHSPPLLLLMTSRPELGPSAELLREVALDSRTVALAGLEPAEARALADELMAAPGGEIASLVAESAGHPLFLAELVRHAASGSPLRAIRLDDALRARVDALEPAAQRLLEIIAVAGEPLMVPVAREAAGLSDGDGMRHLAVLRAGLFVRSSSRSTSDGVAAERVECYHDRVREAVSDHLPAARTAAHHQALAAALEAAGAGDWAPLALVRHLEAAGDSERAGALATIAARRAADGLAFDRAAELYRTALGLTAASGLDAMKHDPERRRTLQIALGDALANAGRALEAASELLAAAQGADATTRRDCNCRAADLLLATGHVDEGLGTLASVLAELGETYPPTPKKALMSLIWWRARLRVRGLKVTLREPADLRPRDLSRIDVYRALSYGLSMIDNVRGADFMSRCTYHALEAGERDRLVKVLSPQASLLASQGEAGQTQAARLVATARKLAEGGPPGILAWPLGAEAINSYFQGRLDDSLAVLPQVISIFREHTTGAVWEMATARLFLALTLRLAGRYGQLRALCEEEVGEAARRGDRYTEATLRRVGGVALLAADDPDGAERDLTRTRWSPPPGQYHMQNWYEWRQRAEIALYRGRAGELQTPAETTFADLRRVFLWRVATTRAEALWLGGRLAVSAADGADRVRLAQARRYARTLAGTPYRFAPMWAHLIDAGVAARRGEHARAAALLDDAAGQARAGSMEVLTSSIELCAASLLSGAEGGDRRGRARIALTARGIADPERFADMLVPGFDLVSSQTSG
jgi:tetratricopeptide (TPR) repeat protein